MNPITHFLAGWTIADQAGLQTRDRAIVSLAGVIADVDGVTIVPDLFNRFVMNRPSYFYSEYHHTLTHGIPAAALTGLAAAIFGTQKWKACLLTLVSFHFHLLCDLFGSRGPGESDIWPLPYLGPFSDRWTWEWSGQWELNAWPNIAFTLILLALVFYRAWRYGYSPLILLSKGMDSAFVTALRNRFGYPGDQGTNDVQERGGDGKVLPDTGNPHR